MAVCLAASSPIASDGKVSLLNSTILSYDSTRMRRKGGMYINTIVSFLACILMFISKPAYSYEVLIVGRFFLGLACGNGYGVVR